jgi:hypothetical protein
LAGGLAENNNLKEYKTGMVKIMPVFCAAMPLQLLSTAVSCAVATVVTCSITKKINC